MISRDLIAKQLQDCTKGGLYIKYVLNGLIKYGNLSPTLN